VSQAEYDAAVAAFIRTKGITRCPTACTHPTEGTVSAADRAALEAYGGDASGCAGVKSQRTPNHFGLSG